MNQSLLIGTRGSALALAQADRTEAALRAVFPDLELQRRIIKTIGDKRTDVPLSQVAKVAGGVIDKGVFTKELEVALERGEAQLAVHSLKDMPTDLDEGFELVAVLERAPVADLLLSRGGYGLKDLPAGSVVGTSSVRRSKQLLHLRPDLKVADIRGNVPTRIEKLARGEFDAILLAEAGLNRLGYDLSGFDCEGVSIHVDVLDVHEFLPAAGQGAIGLETLSSDRQSAEFAKAINHHETWTRITAEREFLHLLQAGCHTPVGVLSELDGANLKLKACVFDEHTLDPPKTAACEGPASDPKALAKTLYLSLK